MEALPLKFLTDFEYCSLLFNLSIEIASKPIMKSKDMSVNFPIYEGTLLALRYEVQAFLGEGSFGKVAKCVDTVTNTEVAIKVTKDEPYLKERALEEIKILKQLQTLDQDKCHLVRWEGSFFHQKFICLKFELLDLSLYDYMQQRHFRPLSMGEIRPLLHQLTTALLHLEGLEIVHADLKLENIMVVDHRQQPLQVKLIDFGLAHHVSDVPDTWVQSLWYRAPEVLLGLNFSEPIDMWSLGLVAAELALGYPVFPAENEYEMMKFIVDTLGQPPDYQLNRALNSTCFFKFDNSFSQTWIVKTPDEFPSITGYKFKDTRGFQSLNVLKMKLFYRNKASRNEVEQFVDLLQKMLLVDKNGRIIPLKVLEHPFFTVEQQSDSNQNMNFANVMDNMGEPNVTQRPFSQGDSTTPLTVIIHEETGITGPKMLSVKLMDEEAVDDTSKKDMGWFISFVSRIQNTACS